MTNSNRLTVVTVMAMIVAFQLLIPGGRLSADENKADPEDQAPSPKQLQEIAKMDATTWQLELRLNMPTMNPQAVQYAILDTDAALSYTAQLKRMRTSNRQMLANADTKSWKGMVRYVQMKIDWDNGFGNVTGDNLNLLTNRPGANSSGNVISSNGPAGKKWVVTKCVFIDNRPYCWCIPVEVSIGKRVYVTLNDSNVFDLRKPYDAAMNEPSLDGDKPTTKK